MSTISGIYDDELSIYQDSVKSSVGTAAQVEITDPDDYALFMSEVNNHSVVGNNSDVVTAETEFTNKVIDRDKLNTEIIVNRVKSLNSKVDSQHIQIQDATTSINIPEPKLADTKVTNVTDNKDTSFSLLDDYPNTYGIVDPAGNYFRSNLVTKEFHIVHGNSGSSIKIDGNGNTTIHITGSLKLVIDKDFATQILGSTDVSITGNSYKHVIGTNEEMIDGSNTINGLSVNNIKGNPININ